jgi:gamma-glutamyltranspeptidase / glutathione hydrolase
MLFSLSEAFSRSSTYLTERELLMDGEIMISQRWFRIRWLLFLAIFIVPSSVPAQQYSLGAKGKEAVGTKVMIATAHPLATQAGMEMFQKGGNAIDATVAAAFAIGVVEPDGSGLGGGGGMLIRLKNGQSVYINYYGQSSSRVHEAGFVYGKDNQTAKAILIPGTVAGLTTALRQYGTLPLSVVLAPAIRYAEKGFPVDETLSKIILDNTNLLLNHPATASVYLHDGFPRTEGDTIRQPELANTMKAVARLGQTGFYEGPVAKSIIDEVIRSGGIMVLDDLSKYQPTFTEPLQGSYRGYTVLTAPPPHSGVTVLEALNILENVNLQQLGYYATSAESFHLLAETMRRAYADRTSFLADPRFEKVPVRGLISREFAKSRFDDISMTAVIPPEYRKTTSGMPAQYDRNDEGDPAIDGSGPKRSNPTVDTLKKNSRSDSPETSHVIEQETLLESVGGHTTQISVMDSEGNMVSLTQTLGTFFGSGVTAAGVLLNNGMSNFASSARVNAVQPNKQPRSSIAPSIILKNGKPFMVVGSPGAARIPATVTILIVNAIDYGLDVEKTDSAPRFLCQKSDQYLSLESRFSSDVQEGMKKKGHQLQLYGEFDLFFGGAQIILVDSSGNLHGCADPRRGGAAMGY